MLLKFVLKTIVAVITVGLATSALADKQMDSRIAPVGSMCMAGDACASAPVVVAAAARSGEEIYNGKCMACHSSGVAGAPKFGDAGAWAARLEKGIDTLYTNAINGIGGMPAKGLCMDCSDDEIKASVDYMVNNSK